MEFIDAYCCLGRLSVPMPRSIDTAKQLRTAMERASVEEALVYHALAAEYDPAIGNHRLLEETAGHAELHPCWVVLPHHTGEMPPPRDLVDEMTDRGVRAARAFPKTHNWTLSEWCSGPLLSALEEKSIPLFIDLRETDWSQAYALSSAHPDLPLVLTEVPFRFSRQVYALLDETENVHIDTSHFQLQGGIEDVCERFGAGRLLFGTSAPHFEMSPSVMAVTYAGVTETEKAMIAGGNLHGLLERAGRAGEENDG